MSKARNRSLTPGAASLAKAGSPAAAVLSLFLVATQAAPAGAGEAEGTVPEGAVPEAAVPAADLAADETEGCVASDTVMCLHDDRFRVTIDLVTQEQLDANEPGTPARVVKGGSRVIGTEQSGLFWFFDPNNWEVLLKVPDACGLEANRGYWVFAASASDQGMRIRVRDTSIPADDGSRIGMREYKFPPHQRRPQQPDESDEDYQRDVVAKGHEALTHTNAFPDSCPTQVAAADEPAS